MELLFLISVKYIEVPTRCHFYFFSVISRPFPTNASTADLCNP